MAKASAKTLVRTDANTVRKRRLSNVQPRTGETLTSTEENTMRMHHGLDVGLHSPLPSNAINAAIRQQLLEIEMRAYEATGRHLQDVGDDQEDEETPPSRPAARNPAKDKILSRLRNR